MSIIFEQGKRAWLLWQRAFRHAIKAQYPDTGGSEHLLHNWYCCGQDPAVAKLAQDLRDYWWGRWNQIDDRCKRVSDRIEHLRNHGRSFQPLWCQYCHKLVN